MDDKLVRLRDVFGKCILVPQLNGAEAVMESDLYDIPVVDAVEVVRCRECAVPHNEMTGCPLLLGIRVDPDFYCKFGYRERRKDDDT